MVELLGSGLFLRAFTAGTIVALITAPVGYFLVLRAHAFAGEALTDVGFAGASWAALLGFSSILGMVLLSVLSAIGLGALGERARGRDIEVGMVLSMALGLGVLALSMYAHSSAMHISSGVNILFGSLFSVTGAELFVVSLCGGAAMISILAVFRPLLFASIDPVVARARGIPMRGLSVLFMIILAVTTASCVLVVGVLLVAALLIAPAAAAVNMTTRPWRSIGLAAGIGIAVTWSGLILAFLGTGRHLPVGFYISFLAGVVYVASFIARKRPVSHFEPAAHHTDREIGSTSGWGSSAPT